MSIYSVTYDCKFCGEKDSVCYIAMAYYASGWYCVKCEKKED